MNMKQKDVVTKIYDPKTNNYESKILNPITGNMENVSIIKRRAYKR